MPELFFSFDSSSIRGNVGQSVGRSGLGVNEFQRVLNALKVYVMNILQGIIQYRIYLCIL